ncbi:hypothetical protein CR194_13895 [Salipaludibacillus keqinensis]|uniref:Transcriptional regulator n=1 Tax=Salipaludibacillus keqinensis TaxID=2045207 RepID=A0A323TBF7_9BACI|nr:MurR/RpiR family transcriptional regulator [Salipaludibacillus keqinensis]PYZ92742.1 hypothetical protein CR194_13895 [Salipaludibacillus keqinensis]
MIHPLDKNTPVAIRIDSHLKALTKSEQKVADFVLNHLDEVMYLSVTDLADKAEVGETTVLRFCRKIGFKGYQEFKFSLAKDISAQSHETKNETKEESFIDSITSHIIQAVQETKAMVDENSLNEGLSMLLKARSIHIFGVGTSGITALDAKSRFLRTGHSVEAITDSHFQAMTAATVRSEDVVIGLSVSGSTKDTIDSLQIAKKNGAKVIAITHHARSPITKLADIVLLSGGKESPLEGGSMTAKIGQLVVIDLLCTGLALEDFDSSIRMKEKTAKSVTGKLY